MFGLGSSNAKMATDEGAAPGTANTDKPLPAPRPGTSGTEALLTSNRRAALTTFSKAERAERTYKARKRATNARADWADAKSHYREAWRNARDGSRMILALVKGSRYILAERRERAKAKEDEKRRQRAAEKRRKLEERIAREEGDAMSLQDGASTSAVA